MENMQINTGAQNVAPKENKQKEFAPKKSRAQIAFEELTENNLGIYPRSVIYDINSSAVEDAILRYLEKKGINTSEMIARCILKEEASGSSFMYKAARNTKLPFIVVLFKRIVENEDYERIGGTRREVRVNLSRVLKNFQDNAQFKLKEDVPLNTVLKIFNNNAAPEWYIQKKNNYAYTLLDADGVMSFLFNKSPETMSNYVFDFIVKPKSHMNIDTRRKEFVMSVALTKQRPKSKPMVDPINFIR